MGQCLQRTVSVQRAYRFRMPKKVFNFEESSGVLSVATDGTEVVGVEVPDFSRDAGREAEGVVADEL